MLQRNVRNNKQVNTKAWFRNRQWNPITSFCHVLIRIRSNHKVTWIPGSKWQYAICKVPGHENQNSLPRKNMCMEQIRRLIKCGRCHRVWSTLNHIGAGLHHCEAIYCAKRRQAATLSNLTIPGQVWLLWRSCQSDGLWPDSSAIATAKLHPTTEMTMKREMHRNTTSLQ